MNSLRDAKKGETVTVLKLHGEGALRRRLMDMGITRGTAIYIRKVAPLGDPVEVRVRGYELSIRKADAELIEIEAPGEAPGQSSEASAAKPAKAPAGHQGTNA